MASPTNRVIVEGVDLARVVMFPKILGACMSSLQPSRLLIGLLMVTTLLTFGRIWDASTDTRIHPDGFVVGVWTPAHAVAIQPLLQDSMRRYAPGDAPGPGESWDTLHPTDALVRIREGYGSSRNADETDPAALATQDRNFRRVVRQISRHEPQGVFSAVVRHVVDNGALVVSGLLSFNSYDLGTGARNLLLVLPQRLFREHRGFALGLGLVAFLVWVVGGGALSRMAACQFAAGVRLRLDDAIDFALSNWIRLALGLLLPLALVAGLATVIVVMGLLMAAPVLEMLGGVAYGIALVVGFFLTFVVVGYVAGFLLIVPAVATECCDGLDADQKVYAYVYQRPLHLIGYGLMGLLGLTIGYIAVVVFAGLMLAATSSLYGLITDTPALSGGVGLSGFQLDRGAVDPWAGGVASGLIGFWHTLVICLVGAYVMSYVCDATTRIFLLLRRSCDHQEIEDVWWPSMAPGLIGPLPNSHGP